MFSGHEEFKNHIPSGLAMVNHVTDYLGSTYHASDTTVAGWKATNNTGFSALHEADKASNQPVNRYVDNLAAMDIYDATDIAASDTRAAAQAIFTAYDPSLPAGFHGSRAR